MLPIDPLPARSSCGVSDADEAGRWVGDPIILACDDGGHPNPNGLLTTTPEHPGRNLHGLATAEYTNISYLALAELSESPLIAAELASKGKESRSFLIDLGAVLDQYAPPALAVALEQAVGRPWRKAYNLAVAESPHWRPLPRIEKG